MMKLRFRMHTEHDIDKLVDFWCEHSGWDTIDRLSWEKRFFNTPYGNAAIAIAEVAEDSSIAAQFIFIPSEILCQGHIYKGYRPFAPVLRKDIRERVGFLQMAKYIIEMYKVAVRSFAQNGISVLYAMPDPRWARLLHLLKGSKIGFFPLYSIPLHSAFPFSSGQEYSFKAGKQETDCINQLWAKASTFLNCCIVRNADALSWKLSHKDYTIISVYRGGKLAGLSASIYKPEDKQWLICDVLAADESEAFWETIKATCLFAESFRQSLPEPEQSRLSKAAILATRGMEQPLSQLGFHQDNYKFPLFVQVLEKNPAKMFSPDFWYISAND